MNARAHDAEDAAALEALVVQYDLRWDPNPASRYPVQLDHVGRGWMRLLEDLVVELIDLGWDRRVAQIKAKFGGLRFYVGEASAAVHGAIARAERRSLCVCDRCGKAARLDPSAMVVRCAEHRAPVRPPPPIRPVAASTVFVARRHHRARKPG